VDDDEAEVHDSGKDLRQEMADDEPMEEPAQKAPHVAKETNQSCLSDASGDEVGKKRGRGRRSSSNPTKD
jgi:hypothetical protein